MQITAYCPECQSRYQLNADLVGRRMRCKTPSCQAIFVIQAAGGGVPQEGPNGPRAADARGELVVPLIGDGPVRPATAAVPAPEFDWRAAPPPVQEAIPVAKPAGPPPSTVTMRNARGGAPRQWEEPAPGRRRVVGLVITIGFAFVAVAAAVGGIAYVIRGFAYNEETLRADAAKDYAGGSFRAAAKKYHELAESNGRSEHAADYRLLADLSDLRDAAAPPLSDPAAALTEAQAFTKKYDAHDPKLKPHRDDVSRAITAIVTAFADAVDAAAQTADGPTTVPDLVGQGRQALDLLRGWPPREANEIADLQARFERAGEVLAKATEKRRAIEAVLAILHQPRPDLSRVRQEAMRRQVADDPVIKREIAQAEEQSLHDIVYEAMNKPSQRTGPPAGPPVLLLETATDNRSLQSATRNPDGVILAVSRGLLYALDGHEGRRLWACRVGLDAGELPARIPAVGDDPELVLVASSEPPGLTARELHSGHVVWHQPLDAPCLGRPVRDDTGRLFVPTAGANGLVYDLDARGGVIRGRFETHQPLAVGGAFDAVTRRLYVPAHGQGVFVFSYGTEGPKFEGLLRTNHPAGSLRGEPIVVTGEAEGPEVARYLVLGEADGLGAMTLRAFRLFNAPTESPRQEAVRLPGWSWFPPYHDSETIALVTDAGAIGLFGIQQKGDEDPPIFPLVPDVGNPKSETRTPKSNRGQLVHASESGFWVLADGVLRHWRLGLTRMAGRRLTPAWGDGLRLGSPLHASQVSADRGTLFIVTQTDTPTSYRATAVDAGSGEKKWQRPLGLAIQGDAIVLGGAVVVLDQSGGLYRFDPARHAAAATDPWQAGGTEIAKPVGDLAGSPFILPSVTLGALTEAWAVLVRPDDGGYRLVLRRVAADGTVTEGSAGLPAPPAGTPALAPNAIVLPLADGQLCRVPLDVEKPKPVLGPTWRAAGAAPDARGHVVHWKGDEFLVSDGGRRLYRLTWPAGSHYDLTQPPLELAQRLVTPPARLPNGGVAVADASGTVTLIGGDRPTVVRAWRLGPVTAGPWAVGDRLAVVVDRRKLVWLNPDAEQPVWTYAAAGDGIDSPPRLVEGKLIVADLSGRFVALDPATGKPAGSGYRFPAEAAPAAAVTAFGPGRLFAPLTDGTVLLLPMAELTK